MGRRPRIASSFGDPAETARRIRAGKIERARRIYRELGKPERGTQGWLELIERCRAIGIDPDE